MDFLGSYKVAVDTKYGIEELVNDVCGKDHERFRDELILAQRNGIQLYILVESDYQSIREKDGIYNLPTRCIDDLFHWKNPRLFIFRAGKQAYPNATKGATLAKACITMEKKYGCRFEFCTSDEAGERVMKLLCGKTETQ